MASPSAGQFCPKCGAVEGSFIGSFCKNCYLKDHPHVVSIPIKLEFSRCNRCEKIRPTAKWVEWDDEVIDRWIISKIRSREIEDFSVSIRREWDERDKKRMNIFATVTGVLSGSPVKIELESKLYVKGGICNDDMLVSSDYYEAIIQVRFTEKTDEKVRAVQQDIEDALKPMHAVDSKAVVVNWSPQKFGLDAWIVSNKAAKHDALHVQRKYKGTVSVSGKQMGLDVHSNKTKFRNTFLVRIP